MGVVIYAPDQQAIGGFDGGKITEQKPIGFSGEGSVVKRIGPLFYWAWAHADQEGYIPLHPHQAFEIITYVINGKAEHGDSLGTKSVVGAGGAQVMQTGSGVSHEERFIGPDMEAFQIWFEPFIQDALMQSPTYHQFEHEAFPVARQGGLERKTVIGEGAPINLAVDAKMWDIRLTDNAHYEHEIPAGYTLATLAVQGDGIWENEECYSFHHKDFIVIDADKTQKYVLKTSEKQDLRVVLIQVPTKPAYKLYPKW